MGMCLMKIRPEKIHPRKQGQKVGQKVGTEEIKHNQLKTEIIGWNNRDSKAPQKIDQKVQAEKQEQKRYNIIS